MLIVYHNAYDIKPVISKQTDSFGGLVSPLSKRRCIRDSDESDDKTQKFKESWKEAAPWPKVANANNSLSAMNIINNN